MKSKKSDLKTLDLHGYTEDEVFSAVDKFLMVNQKQTQVRIIHGKGKGIVKKKVIDYLQQAHYPFKTENIGSVIVFLD